MYIVEAFLLWYYKIAVNIPFFVCSLFSLLHSLVSENNKYYNHKNPAYRQWNSSHAYVIILRVFDWFHHLKSNNLPQKMKPTSIWIKKWDKDGTSSDGDCCILSNKNWSSAFLLLDDSIKLKFSLPSVIWSVTEYYISGIKYVFVILTFLKISLQIQVF